MSTSKRFNDEERRMWIMNDEGLYQDWQRSGAKYLRAYIRENRARIDEVIRNVSSGHKPAHYLAYPKET